MTLQCYCHMHPFTARPPSAPKLLPLVTRCSLSSPGWLTRDSLRPPLTAPRSRAWRAGCVCAASTSTALPALLEVEQLRVAEGAVAGAPAAAGVYAVYDSAGTLQYVGLSRKIAVSLANHARDLPDLAHAVRYAPVPDATRDNLTAAWKAWIEQAVEETGQVPPGNATGNTQWSARRARPEIRLTPGKGAADLTCSVGDLIDGVVKSNKVVAFVKGTRTAPQCGFSHRVMSLLTEVGAPFDVVNVLDETHNPGLREAIKAYSQWPTIPQVYINGEFVGGADILEELHQKGELQQLVRQ